MTLKDSSLPKDVLDIIRRGATERPHTGSLTNFYGQGTYLCRGCGRALFRADAKFSSSCGWPSFDESIAKTVVEKADADGMRTEIVCRHCLAHLGHVFAGEGFTLKNKRYCVNSRSLDFVASQEVIYTEEAIVAGGCFWGVEHYLSTLPSVLLTEVGYTGGNTDYPTYHTVCSQSTGHVEALRVIYDPQLIDYKSLLQYFFEIHDPFQFNGQGPDWGPQYQSAVFYYDEEQKFSAQELINRLNEDRPVATKLLPVCPFWLAEFDHQNYYAKNQKQPYCHRYIKRF